MTAKFWVAAVLAASVGTLDPLAVVAPAVQVSAAERVRLDRGDLVSRVLPARKGQVAVFAATRVEVSPAALVAAAGDIADLKKSRFVTAAGRFSDPPLLSDLDALTLDRHDRDVLRACDVGDCSFKLPAIEIEAIRRARYGDVDGEQVTAALRRVMLERTRAYLHAGLAALPPIHNRAKPWHLHDVLTAALAASPALLLQPPLSAWLRDAPVPASLDTFVYWSQEQFGAGKPVTLITHVAAYQPSPDLAVVVGKQIFASRYLNGGLSMTAISTAPSGERYLVYLNRSTVDLFTGVLGGLTRATVESHLSKQLPHIAGRLRDRLERSHHDSRPGSVRHH